MVLLTTIRFLFIMKKFGVSLKVGSELSSINEDLTGKEVEVNRF